MNTPTCDELLDELAAELHEPEEPVNGITVKMLMDKTGRSERVCRTLLDRKIYQGKMATVFIKGRKWYYAVE